jgi:lactoylglutathione lyase
VYRFVRLSGNLRPAQTIGETISVHLVRIEDAANHSGIPAFMKIYELDHVAIHVKDVPASCEFYRNVLRLVPIPRPGFTFPGAWFRLGAEQELHIIGERSDHAASDNRGHHFALRVDDLEAWESHLRSLKIDFRPRKKRPDGAWQVFTRDPDGHEIELFIPPESTPQHAG